LDFYIGIHIYWIFLTGLSNWIWRAQ